MQNQTIARLCALMFLFAAGAACAASSSRPNLVFVFPDQMRAQSLGFLGADPVITPRLDTFAQQAQFFPNAISTVPICSPFRAMLMTGRYPLSTGITANLFASHNHGLSTNEVAFGTALQRAGYQTGYIGKWHLSNPEELPGRTTLETYLAQGATFPGPGRHGFDYVLQTFVDHKNKNATFWENSRREYTATWSVDFATDKAIEFIRHRKADTPFALFVSWGPPHAPFVVPQEYIDMYRNRALPRRPNHNYHDKNNDALRYYAGVTWCDDQFGRILDALREQDLEKNTVVVFTSDHGEVLGSHGDFNEKTYWYEESLKIPLLIRWPERVPAGTNTMLFPVQDFMPTLLGLMKVQIPRPVEGMDWSRNVLARNQRGPPSAFFAHYPYMAYDRPWVELPSAHVVIKQGLIRRGLGYGDLSQLGFRGVTTGRFTYVFDRCPVDEPGISFNWRIWNPAMAYTHPGQTRVREFFYDNEKDHYQMNPIPIDNRAYRSPIALARRELRQWLKKTHDPFQLD